MTFTEHDEYLGDRLHEFYSPALVQEFQQAVAVLEGETEHRSSTEEVICRVIRLMLAERFGSEERSSSAYDAALGELTACYSSYP